MSAQIPSLFDAGQLDWPPCGVDRFEINKAFAAITLALMSELGVPDDVVNV